MRLREFYSRNRWTYKTHFFIFQFFPQKLINGINSNFYRLKLFILCIIVIFLKKFNGLVWELLAFKKKHVYVNNKRTVIARNFF